MLSPTNLIIGVTAGVLLGSLIIAFRQRWQDFCAALFIVGVAGLGVVVTISVVDQYHEQRAASRAAAETQPMPESPPVTAFNRSRERPPVAFVTSPPLTRGPTGSAAPPAVENPYAGGSR